MMQIVDNLVVALHKKADELKSEVKRLVGCIDVARIENKTSVNQGIPDMSNKNNSIASLCAVVGVAMAILGFIWLGVIVGALGVVSIFIGYYLYKTKNVVVHSNSADIDTNLSSVTSVLYSSIESMHKKNSQNWDDFIEKQRLNINELVKAQNFELTTQNKLLDSQMSNSVLVFNVMKEFSILNVIGRANDVSQLKEYLSSFESRYYDAIDKAVNEQECVYRKLNF